ncbi:MAG TPA: hypothetical protein VIU11_27555 [Nakamurella sp.]
MKEFLRTLTRVLLGIGAAALVVATAQPAAADNVPINQRTYLVLAQTIKAFDETGPVNSGLSDEIYGGFRTTSVSGQVFDSQTRLFGNFDAGQTRTFPSTQACLSEPNIQVNNSGGSWPSGLENDEWGCLRGISAPFSVRAVFWEADFPYPSCFPLCAWHGNGPLGEEYAEDDPVGDQTLAFSQQGLAADLPNAGNTGNYAFDLKKSSGHYRVTVMVYRMT